MKEKKEEAFKSVREKILGKISEKIKINEDNLKISQEHKLEKLEEMRMNNLNASLAIKTKIFKKVGQARAG